MLAGMPTLAVIFGITITMNFDDHVPPHFHARKGGDKATYLLDGSPLEGKLHPGDDKRVRDWAQRHAIELAQAWENCSNNTNPGRIS